MFVAQQKKRKLRNVKEKELDNPDILEKIFSLSERETLPKPMTEFFIILEKNA